MEVHRRVKLHRLRPVLLRPAFFCAVARVALSGCSHHGVDVHAARVGAAVRCLAAVINAAAGSGGQWRRSPVSNGIGERAVRAGSRAQIGALLSKGD